MKLPPKTNCQWHSQMTNNSIYNRLCCNGLEHHGDCSRNAGCKYCPHQNYAHFLHFFLEIYIKAASIHGTRIGILSAVTYSRLWQCSILNCCSQICSTPDNSPSGDMQAGLSTQLEHRVGSFWPFIPCKAWYSFPLFVGPQAAHQTCKHTPNITWQLLHQHEVALPFQRYS